VGRSRRKITYALVGAAACVAAMFALAGLVGSDVLPGGQSRSDEGLAAPALADDEDGTGKATPKDAVDPWTGKPYTETTAPGPTRPDAKPTKESPAKLAPKPTRAKNRDALIEGAKPPPAPSTGGDDGTQAPVGGDTSTAGPPPPVETTTDDPPPPVETTTEDPPPPVETTTEDPPPPVETTTEDPPPADPGGGDPPAGDPPAADPPPGEGGGS
jgi:hypothetical protein